jgi:adenosine deaminase
LKKRTSADLSRIEKVELHQHVDGSIPVSLTWQLMKRHGLNPVESLTQMEKLLILQKQEEGTLLRYLDKFHYPLWITQFYENIMRAVEAIVEEAYQNHVRLLELRYSPIIHTYAGLTLRQTISAALGGINRAKARYPIQVGLIVIAMRQHGPHIARILARSAVSEGQQYHARTGVIGFDVAGAERGNPPKLFKEAYAIARIGGLGLTIHAGEDESPTAVWQSIDELGVTRIGHGCSAVRDKALLRRLARDRILIECCISSNFQTGAVKRGRPHPIFTFLEYGIPVAVCTDNTTVSGTSQNLENQRLTQRLSVSQISSLHKDARNYSFIRSGLNTGRSRS